MTPSKHTPSPSQTLKPFSRPSPRPPPSLSPGPPPSQAPGRQRRNGWCNPRSWPALGRALVQRLVQHRVMPASPKNVQKNVQKRCNIAHFLHIFLRSVSCNAEIARKTRIQNAPLPSPPLPRAGARFLLAPPAEPHRICPDISIYI